MKRFLALLATGALALTFSSSAFAQAGPIGAGALILTNPNSTPLSPKTVTITTPQSPSAEYTAWSNAGFPNLVWSVPVPPSNNAQAGFVYSGPLSGAVIPHIAYWVPPGQIGFNNNGGFAGAWDYATKTQLGLLSASLPLNPNQVVTTDATGDNLVTAVGQGTTTTVLHGSPNAATQPSWGAVVSADIQDGTIANVDLAGGVYAAITGLGAQSQALNMGTHQINNVVDPTLTQDAATKNYVDNTVNTAVNGTINTIPKFTAQHVVGNSLLTDDGTTLNYNAGKFTVLSANGNTVAGGTLTSTGNFNVNGNFNVAAATGNTGIGAASSVNTRLLIQGIT